MKKILMVATLALVGQGMAASWDYATYTIISSSVSKPAYFWISPDKTGAAMSGAAEGHDALAEKINCMSFKPEGRSFSDVELFRCFGQRGWELLFTDDEIVAPGVRNKIFYFKRSMP